MINPLHRFIQKNDITKKLVEAESETTLPFLYDGF
jgi:hypothetical protein